MKKIITLLLCVIMLACSLTSCIRTTSEYKGVEIPIYLSDPLYTLDPAYAYLDDGAVKVLSLIYEGLYTLDDKGKPVEAMAKGYETYTDRDGNFVCEFELNETKWNDGRTVSANDFVFAWKRILQPDFDSPAASLLYDVKNATKCKKGDVSIDYLGVAAVGTRTLQVTFEKEIDIEEFIAITASPALVPLRDDKVSRLDNWASSYVTMAANGPFYVKLYESADSVMTLERNIHYFRNSEKAFLLDSKVKPFKLVIYFNSPASLEAEDPYANVKLAFASNLAYSGGHDKAEVLPTLSTHTYIFNTTKAPFDNADVRKALSLALDRNEMVELITYAEAAQGIIPEGVFDADGKSFREAGGELVSASADMAQAKSLAAAATTKDFTITVREGDIVSNVIAQYAVEKWAELGFNVTIVQKGYYQQDWASALDYVQYNDLFYQTYEAGEFDIIAVDQIMYSTYAFTNLASFAKDYSGRVDIENDYVALPHISGYDNEDYNTLIEKAYAATGAERSELLHQAESKLIEDMPVIPLFVHQNAYIKTKDLTGLDTNYYGAVTFKDAKLKKEEDYKIVFPDEY